MRLRALQGPRTARRKLCAMTKPRVPKALDSIVDLVLAYKPKAKSKPARRRKRRATKIAKEK